MRTSFRLALFWLMACVLVGVSVGHAANGDSLVVRVKGLEGHLRANVEAALALPPGLVREGRIDRRWLRRFQTQVPKRVAEACAPYGYFSPEVTTVLESPDPSTFELVVNVATGNPVRLQGVIVRLEGDGAWQRRLKWIVADFPLAKGDVLRQDLYEKAKGRLKAKALDMGYLDADYRSAEIRVHREELSAEIELVLDTGPRYAFGYLLLHGAPTYPERFLRRYLSFGEGKPFDPSLLGQTQLNFLDSDRFRDVLVTPVKELAKDLEVPIDIQLVPSERFRLRPGIGYGTDTGARLSFRYQDVNVFHLGHEFKVDLLLAELRQSLVGLYAIPGARNIESLTALRLGYDREDLDSYETSSIFAEAERVRGFGKGRLGSVFVRLLQERSVIGGEDFTSRMVIPGVRFSRRRYKDPIRPKEGYHFRLEARGGHQSLGSDTDLLQTLASGNALVPLGARFSAFFRLQGAYTLQSDPLAEFPVSLRFFAGGDQSVRGYAYQSLGPRDADGEVTGGKHLLVGSAELERAMGKNWGTAVFIDAGNAFNSTSGVKLARGAGVGLRWYTQVGPIRFDVARQMGVRDPAIRVHLSVGFGW